MDTIETERLLLVPLDEQQLSFWVSDMAALEKNLNCSYQAEAMEGIFLEIVKKQLEKVKADKAHALFHTFFFLLRKSDRVVVGSMDFKDLPNEQGECEIGYGLGPDFEHCGYMTEAVNAFCKWGLAQPGLTVVTAETEKENLASQAVLKRNGFVCYKQAETFWWRLLRLSAY